MIGERISHYEILEKLGQGGMGVVYKAHDTKLNRTVALKFLTPDLTVKPDAVDRFINEAQAASALDHPNICAIHEIGETDDGQMFICMAYCAGVTVQEKLRDGALPKDAAINIAAQLADGLSAVHAAGIIHRDIKSSNIIITERDEVKIVDFGIAKLAGVSQLTQTGRLPGTVAYMSPEQVQGQPVDARSDIWSLGVVLYEMLTGKLPFGGEHEATMIYAIMNEEPATLVEAREKMAAGLHRIVNKALQKEPDRRYQTSQELLADLRQEKLQPSAAAKSAFRTRRKKLSSLQILLAIFALLVTAGLVFALLRGKVKTTSRVKPPTHTQLTFTGQAFLPEISPDGQAMSYEADLPGDLSVLMIQELAGGEPKPIFQSVARLYSRWSPNGSELWFCGGNDSLSGSFVVSRQGEKRRAITSGRRGNCFASWSPDGAQIAECWENDKRIYLIDKMTGARKDIALREELPWINSLDWSPTDSLLLFCTNVEGRGEIWTVTTKGQQLREVTSDTLRIPWARWSADGKAIYYFRALPTSQTVDLMKLPIAAGEAGGPAATLLTGITNNYTFSISKNGKRLLQAPEKAKSNLWLLASASENEKRFSTAKPLTAGTSYIFDPSISPDGKQVAFVVLNTARGEVYAMPVEGGPMKQMTFLNSVAVCPVWSQDGKTIAFVSDKNGKRRVWVINVVNGAPREFKQSDVGIQMFLAWTPSAEILYQRSDLRSFHLLNPATETERAFVPAADIWNFSQPRYSPDGKTVALHYKSQESAASSAIWLVNLETSAWKLLYDRHPYVYPAGWSPDGKWLYAAETVDSQTLLIRINIANGEARTLAAFPFDYTFSDITRDALTMTPDGKRFICTRVEYQSDVWMTENFDPEVE